MFIPPVERARVKRQQPRPATTTAQAQNPQNPIESFLSNILNPGSPTTSTTKGSTATSTTKIQPQPSESTAVTATTPTLISTTRATTSSSTNTLTASSQRTTSSTSPPPLVTAEDSNSINPSSTVVVTQTASSQSSSPTVDASNNNPASANGAMTPLVKGIVISASVIFGLIFFALVIRKLFQFRRHQKRVSWADNISPFAPTANETGYEKPLPQEPAPIPAPAPAPPAPTRYGSQDAGYGPMMGAGRPSFGANPDQRNSRYSTTGTGYATYQNYPVQLQTMQPYVPPAPYTYNPAAMGAGPAPAAVGGPSGLAHNGNINLAASPPEMPNPFIVSPVDAAGPVPITVPGAPPAAGQQILVVKRTFTPNLEDELSIAAGESVRIVAVYDDGWCKVRKLGAGGEEGVVPYECLDNPPTGAQPGLNTAEERKLEAR